MAYSVLGFFVFDPTPTTQAFLASLPPAIAASAKAVEFMESELLLNGEHRMHFMKEVAPSLRDRAVGLVYDRASGIVIAGGFGVHTRQAAIVAIMRTEPMEKWDKCMRLLHLRDEWADRFVETGLGFLSSGVSATMGRHTLLVGEDVALSAQEKLWFAHYDIKRI